MNKGKEQGLVFGALSFNGIYCYTFMHIFSVQIYLSFFFFFLHYMTLRQLKLTFKNAAIKNQCTSPEMVFRVLVGSYHKSGI